MASTGIDVRACASEDEAALSLEIHNTVWPHRAVTMDEVRSFQAGSKDYADFLATVDGEEKGSAAIAILPQRPSAGRADASPIRAIGIAGGRRRRATTARAAAILLR